MDHLHIALRNASPIASAYALTAVLANTQGGPGLWLLGGILVMGLHFCGVSIADKADKLGIKGKLARTQRTVPVSIRSDRRRHSRQARRTIILIYLLNLLDFGFTLYASRYTDPDFEMNWLARRFMGGSGLYLALFKFSLVAFCCGVLLRRSEGSDVRAWAWLVALVYLALMAYWIIWFSSMYSKLDPRSILYYLF
jgi:uncharacterized protein DUF5658